MKLASNRNPHALSHPINDDQEIGAMLTNHSEEGNNESILSKSHQQRVERRSSVDNLEHRRTIIEDHKSLHKDALTKYTSEEGNNNCSLSNSNQPTNPVFLKKQTEMRSDNNHESCNKIIDNHKSLHKAILKNNNSEDDATTKNNNNNIVPNWKQNVSADFSQKSDADCEADYIQEQKHCFQSGIHDQYISCPDYSSNSNLTDVLSRQHTTVSDTSIRGFEIDSNCSTSLYVDTALQHDREGQFIQEDAEYHAAQDMATLNRRKSSANNNADVLKDVEENSELLPDYIKILAEGKKVCGDSYVTFSKPEWLDMEKFQRGQQFAMDHIFGVMFAELLSLMMLFALRGGLEPLIFTGKSDTPFKAFTRYLSTVTRVKSWYEGDIWDEDSLAHKNLKTVRDMHELTRKRLENFPQQEVAKRVTLENQEVARPMWTDLREEILHDFQSPCPFSGFPSKLQKEVFINQYDMAVTQFGFLGLILVFPKMFGIHGASKEDLEGFAHFWRTIGYLLGTEDRFSLCDGDLKTVQQRCMDIIEYLVKPALRTVSRDWVHMSRCLFTGVSFYVPNVSFESLLMYLFRVLNIKAVKLAASLTFWQYFHYLATLFTFWFTFRLPGMWRLHNWLINCAVNRALHMGPERRKKFEQRIYPYETSSDAVTTRL